MAQRSEFFDGAQVPDIGDEVVIPVRHSPTRTSFFPDQVATISTGEFYELILLRQELIIRSQRGTVLDKRDDAVQISFTPHQVRPELLDIAHVRLASAPAMDMAITILAQAVQSQGMDLSAIIQRLQSSVEQAT